MDEDTFAELQSSIYDQAIDASAELPITTIEVLLTGIAAELRVIRRELTGESEREDWMP